MKFLNARRRGVLALVVVIIAVLFFIYGWISAGSEGWKWQGWGGIAAVSTFLAVAVALVLAIAGDSISYWGLSPRLSLTLEPEPFHFQKFLLPEGAGAAEYDIRVSVTNAGTVTAKQVVLDAAKLEVRQPDGTFAPDPTFMAMNLEVTHFGSGTLVVPVVDPGIPRSFDLLQVHYRDPTFIRIRNFVQPVQVDPGGGRPQSYPSKKEKGRYRLTLAIGADGIEVKQRVVEFEWSGKWSDDRDDFFNNQLKVKLIDA